ncbi:Fosmidomycin resistance protein [Pigmentiphaga humi]|uniref:Fosmidomycin resistance protein n=1 Tax=Pigmentiphaga humi TaxID=2478468 RepID=A0A3P4B7R7_9BURK|nr:MFS transporter [Pigmentiphaga humi]VCU72092.1 Fosmidomycin resistance protein [Pigmentiphaga humi]
MQQALVGSAPRFIRRRVDWSVIGLVGIAHACSHFFQLVIPSLFVPLAAEFGLSFAQLGVLVAVFYAISGVGQASSGFVVDRAGARPVLWFGLSCFVLAGFLLGSAGSYAWLFVAAVVAGIGNAVFHPVDFSILNRRVSAPRLGHAFSAHGITGNLGWATTPIFITTLTQLFNWRVAAIGAGLLVAVVLTMTIVGRRLLAAGLPRAAARPAQGGAPAATRLSLGALLRNPVVWGAFLFFMFSSIAISAVQNYTLPILGAIYGLSTVTASTALSGYMVAGAVGMVLGGFLVSSNPHSERIVGASFVAAGLLLALLAMGWLPAAGAVPCVALAGLCAGVAGPSRDMLVRRVTPRGATGSVYGLVYSGMDTGAALAPLAFGVMLDAGLRQGPYLGAFVAFGMSAFFAALIAAQARRLH